MKGNEGMEWHLHLNSTFHLLWAPKRFTNPAEQNHLRKTSKWSRPSSFFLHTPTYIETLHIARVYTRVHTGLEKKIFTWTMGVRKYRQLSETCLPLRSINSFYTCLAKSCLLLKVHINVVYIN